MPKIIVCMQGMGNRELALAKAQTSLGRRPYNDVVINDLTVSGEHALLHLKGAQVLLQDLGSTNGTYVNGQAIQRRALQNGDVIAMGSYKIQLLADDPSEPVHPVPACIKVLIGRLAGRELLLTKAITTIGKASVRLLTICKRGHGYVVQQVPEAAAPATLNGLAIGSDPLPLKHGDVIDMVGNQLQFLQPESGF